MHLTDCKNNRKCRQIFLKPEFLQNLFGILPEYFKDENELRIIWSNPITCKAFLEKLASEGYGKDVLMTLQKLII